MKRLLLILSLAFIFICTGCSDIKYSLVFDEKGISENISLTDKHSVSEDLPNNYMPDMSAFEVFFQSLPYDSGSDSSGNFYARKKFDDINDYVNNSFVFSKYINSDSFKINGKKIKINLNIDSINGSYTNNPIEISFTIPYYVSSHNATKVSGKTYIWEIDNLENAHIKINFDMGKKDGYMVNIIGIFIIVGICATIVGVVIYFVLNGKKNNEI